MTAEPCCIAIDYVLWSSTIFHGHIAFFWQAAFFHGCRYRVASMEQFQSQRTCSRPWLVLWLISMTVESGICACFYTDRTYHILWPSNMFHTTEHAFWPLTMFNACRTHTTWSMAKEHVPWPWRICIGQQVCYILMEQNLFDDMQDFIFDGYRKRFIVIEI